jgi:hypothetical protein
VQCESQNFLGTAIKFRLYKSKKLYKYVNNLQSVMEQNPSLEANSVLVGQEISCLLRNSKIHFHVQKNSAFLPCPEAD